MKSANKLISIGMPVYNGQKYIKEAIESLLSQTYTNFELIIADDNSTDRSKKTYEAFAHKDKRIRIFHHKKTVGFVQNFNYVLKKANGEFFLWAAQDDIRDKNALKELMNLYEKFPDAVLSVSNYKNLHGNKSYFVYKSGAVDNNQNKLESVKHFLQTSNLSFFYGLHKTENIKKSGGYLKDSRPFFKSSDFLTIYKALLGGKFVYTPKVLFYKRDTGLYTKQFETLENSYFDTVVIKKIIRYLFFPLFYLYDLVFGIYFLLQSSFSFFEKIVICVYLFRNTLERTFKFLLSVIKGVLYFMKGIFKKLFI